MSGLAIRHQTRGFWFSLQESGIFFRGFFCARWGEYEMKRGKGDEMMEKLMNGMMNIRLLLLRTYVHTLCREVCEPRS